MKRYIFAISVLFFFATPIAIIAQGIPRVLCGDVVMGNFTSRRQVLSYKITLQPGDTVHVVGSRFGDYLRFLYYENKIFAPSNSTVASQSRFAETSSVDMASGVLGEPGDYTIQFGNEEAFGAFTFSVGCTRNGQLYSETLPPAPESPATNSVNTTSSQPISFGYLGLAALDFSGISLTTIIPELYGIPLGSSIPVGGTGITGYRVEAIAGDILEISAQQSTGNLPVGFVVFAEPNISVFIAGPISSSTFSTEITLPQDGNYVIGLFRMGDAPADGQDTAFQIRVSLNP